MNKQKAIFLQEKDGTLILLLLNSQETYTNLSVRFQGDRCKEQSSELTHEVLI